MNAASFVEKLSFSFSGNLFPQALALGDVDNDGVNMYFNNAYEYYYYLSPIFCLRSFLVVL